MTGGVGPAAATGRPGDAASTAPMSAANPSTRGVQDRQTPWQTQGGPEPDRDLAARGIGSDRELDLSRGDPGNVEGLVHEPGCGGRVGS